MKVCVVGAGYVGLVSGACLSDFGHKVIVVDNDREKINDLNNGKIPIYEPSLNHMIEQGKKLKLLGFSSDLENIISESEIIMIAVGTPANASDGNADLSFVFNVAEEISAFLSSYSVVVTKSTVPCGTSEKIAHIIQKNRPDLERYVDFDVASNPEFLREGSAISDFMNPDRVVIGIDNDKTKEYMKKLYNPLYLMDIPFVFTDITTSELIKYTSNAFLATKISFINQISDLCEKTKGNIKDLAYGVGLDTRIGSKFLSVSPGYGGSCFPKDTRALCRSAEEHGVDLSIVNAASRANDLRKVNMAQRIIEALKEKYGECEGKYVGILGITFKANTDDLREAPSLTIISQLEQMGCHINVYDPLYNKTYCEKPLPVELENVSLKETPYDVASDAHALVILTEWNSFRGLDLDIIYSEMDGESPLLLDYRNIYTPKITQKFDYRCLGK